MTKCYWNDVHQLKTLLMGAVEEMEVGLKSLPDDWAEEHITKQSAVTWLEDKGEISLLGAGVYGIPESVGFQVSPNAILLATLDHYIVGYSTLYISRKIEPKLFPFHVMASLVGTDAESLSSGKLNNDEWERLSAVIGKLLMATFCFANWHTITLSELDEIIASLRTQDDQKPLVVIDDALLLSDWQSGTGMNEEIVIHQLEWLASQHGAVIQTVIPRSSQLFRDKASQCKGLLL